MGSEALIRAVVDTNVLVSAIRRGTTTRRVAEAWIQGRFRLLVSKPIVEEYLRVLSYPKLHLAPEEIRQIMEEVALPFAEVVQRVSPVTHLQVEPDDLKFLACAVGGKADYLVTGDEGLLKVERFRFVQVVSPAKFLDLFS